MLKHENLRFAGIMMSARNIVMCVALGALAAPLEAQQAIPVREYHVQGRPSDIRFTRILGIRELANNRILVNDAGSRRLLVMSGDLSEVTIVLDSSGATGYGATPTPIIPFRGDSTLFVDGQSSSLILISPEGKVVRSLSAPKTADIHLLASGKTATDIDGNLIYRGDAPAPASDSRLADFPAAQRLMVSDSSPIVRANFERRSVDTLAWYRTGTQQKWLLEENGGRKVLTLLATPIAEVDDWTLLSNGSLAIIRGHDYHVDVLRNGRLVAAAKAQMDWRPLSDVDKQAVIDSAKRARDAASLGAGNVGRGGSPATLLSPGGARVRVRGGASPVSANELKVDFVSPRDLPDFVPPIRPGAALSDHVAQMWVLPTTSRNSLHGELVYDVFDDAGSLKFRARVPPNTSILGFGKAGALYLMQRDEKGWFIARASEARK